MSDDDKAPEVDHSELALAMTVAALAMVDAHDDFTGLNVRKVVAGEESQDARLNGPFTLTLAQLSAINITILMATLAKVGLPRMSALPVGVGVIETLRDQRLLDNMDALRAELHKTMN